MVDCQKLKDEIISFVRNSPEEAVSQVADDLDFIPIYRRS
jgi:hypothetical protein